MLKCLGRWCDDCGGSRDESARNDLPWKLEIVSVVSCHNMNIRQASLSLSLVSGLCYREASAGRILDQKLAKTAPDDRLHDENYRTYPLLWLNPS